MRFCTEATSKSPKIPPSRCQSKDKIEYQPLQRSLFVVDGVLTILVTAHPSENYRLLIVMKRDLIGFCAVCQQDRFVAFSAVVLSSCRLCVVDGSCARVTIRWCSMKTFRKNFVADISHHQLLPECSDLFVSSKDGVPRHMITATYPAEITSLIVAQATSSRVAPPVAVMAMKTWRNKVRNQKPQFHTCDHTKHKWKQTITFHLALAHSCSLCCSRSSSLLFVIFSFGLSVRTS